jgi:small RNA 2'-O-methyltransferase
MPTELHEERLETVKAVLLDSGATSVLDLGCGTGELLVRLIGAPSLAHIVGVDPSASALSIARAQLIRAGGCPDRGRVLLLRGSCTEYDHRLEGFDAAALIETVEHIEPERLSRMESILFRRYRPRTVVITTPNRDYNPVHGVPEGGMRHRDHRFEWGRSPFRKWATGVAGRSGYQVTVSGIGTAHPRYGSSTQMAIFSRQ